MTDQRPPEAELEHDEYHSSLEIDDSSGWRVMIIPIVLILLVIGMIAFFFIYSGDLEPDPRVADRLKAKAEEKRPVEPLPAPPVEINSINPQSDLGTETAAPPAPAG